MLKKCLSLGLIFSCSLSNAGSMGPVCTAEGVTVPCNLPAWDVGISALYIKPTSGFTNRIRTNFNQRGNTRILETSSDWAFKLEASYYFNTGNDINFNWLHYNGGFGTNYNGIRGDQGEILVPTSFNFRDKLDIENFEFGQHVQFSSLTKARFHGGMEYLKSINQNYKTTDSPGDPREYSKEKSNYNGAGPRVGTDLSHELGHGFKGFAKGAVAVLFGQSKSRFLRGSSSLQLESYSGKRHQVVPGLDLKLGLGYGVYTGMGRVDLSAGWMLQRYYDMLIEDGGFINDPSYTISAPFVKAQWVG